MARFSGWLGKLKRPRWELRLCSMSLDATPRMPSSSPPRRRLRAAAFAGLNVAGGCGADHVSVELDDSTALAELDANSPETLCTAILSYQDRVVDSERRCALYCSIGIGGGEVVGPFGSNATPAQVDEHCAEALETCDLPIAREQLASFGFTEKCYLGSYVNPGCEAMFAEFMACLEARTQEHARRADAAECSLDKELPAVEPKPACEALRERCPI